MVSSLQICKQWGNANHEIRRELKKALNNNIEKCLIAYNKIGNILAFLMNLDAKYKFLFNKLNSNIIYN